MLDGAKGYRLIVSVHTRRSVHATTLDSFESYVNVHTRLSVHATTLDFFESYFHNTPRYELETVQQSLENKSTIARQLVRRNG